MTAREVQNVHPFFQQPVKGDVDTVNKGGVKITPNDVNGESDQSVPNLNTVDASSTTTAGLKRKPRRKAKGINEEDAPSTLVNRSITSLLQPQLKAEATTSLGYTCTDEVQIISKTDGTRRKRRRLTPEVDDQPSWLEQLQTAAGDAVTSNSTTKARIPTALAIAEGAAVHDCEAPRGFEEINSAPVNQNQSLAAHSNNFEPVDASPKEARKTLKLNGAGGFGSPNTKRSDGKASGSVSSSSPKRGKRRGKKKEFFITISYGEESEQQRLEVGRKIDDILQSPIELTNRQISSNPAPKAAVNPSKPPHPFFSAKPLVKPNQATSTASETRTEHGQQSVSKPNVTLSATPGKLRSQMQTPLKRPLNSRAAGYHAECRTEKIFRLPGTVDAAWPYRSHTRIEPPSDAVAASFKSKGMVFRKSKRKERMSTTVSEAENVLIDFQSSLSAAFMTRGDFTRPTSVAQPPRLVLSGESLKRKVLEELHGVSVDETSIRHPAFRKLIDLISTTQSPFDLGRCENLSWAHKYAPKTAAEVLQPEKEMRILKSWLESQMISSSGGTISSSRTHEGSARSVMKNKDGKKRRKKRKISEELDGFVVDSDEDLSNLRHLSDDDGSIASDVGARSLVQEGTLKEVARKANAVLISGPHGCGKSASVFAVAKELNFEVFEIGPGSRRSGKDILDRVGDMALNHQVSRANRELVQVLKMDEPDEEEQSFLVGEPSADQSTLNSFFTKPKKSKMPKPAKEVAITKNKNAPAPGHKKSSNQKQSLILLEEVDILFEQDRAFWETVLHLALQSKRPIVMTCNDESLVPVEELSLHALLRFRTPSPDLVVEHLLLLAAAEGHLLSRDAVMSLTDIRKGDLRYAITQLNFWCQMALGDPKGGMSWFMDCQSSKAKMNTNGEKSRVVSVGTYEKSLGFPTRDVLGDKDINASKNEYIIREAWAGWQSDPFILASTALEQLMGWKRANATQAKDNKSSKSSEFRRLQRVERVADLISATDICCLLDPQTISVTQEKLDPTQPPLPESQIIDFVEGYRLMQATSQIDYTDFASRLGAFHHERIWSDQPHAVHVGLFDVVPVREELLRNIHNPPQQFERNLDRNYRLLSRACQPFTDPVYAYGGNKVMSTEIAPYVRSIATFDVNLERQRAWLSTSGNKPRTTRASRSALEGGQRANTRRERWFHLDTDLSLVLSTGGADWSLPSSMPAPSQSSSDPGVTACHRQSSVDELDQVL